MASLVESSTPRFSALSLFQTLVRWEWPMRLLNPLLGDFNPFLPEFRVDRMPSAAIPVGSFGVLNTLKKSTVNLNRTCSPILVTLNRDASWNHCLTPGMY